MLCSVCGKGHPVENIEKSFRLPDAVFRLSEEDRETRAKISSGFCTWDEKIRAKFDDLEGVLANAFPVYDGTVGLPLRIVRNADTRPFFYVLADHPLQHDQRDGISADMPIHYAHL